MIETAPLPPLLQRPGIRQFIKFCIIGFSGLALDATISYLLTYRAGMDSTPAKMISFIIAASNSFFWNSLWTFRGMGSGRRHEMYLKFLAVSTVGFCLNILLFKSVLLVFTGRFRHQGQPDKLHFLIATVVAAVCVAFWNFFINKKWTFAEARGSTHGSEEEMALPL